MNKEELFFKTVFCCMACDGDIATEEVELVKELCKGNTMFAQLDAEKLINSWISDINEQGRTFLQSYLRELQNAELNAQEQKELVSLAFQTIEADNVIEYTEVKFFKKIRKRLSLGDEEILADHPDKEDFLLPDIIEDEDLIWNEENSFKAIGLKQIE